MELRLYLRILLLLVCSCLFNDKCLTYALTREAFPCDHSLEHFEVSAHSRDTVIVPANLTFCDGNYSWDSKYNGFRITTRMLASDENVNTSTPLVFVARQPVSDGIVSWNVPLNLQLNGTNISQVFRNISHTMCPFKFNAESPSSDKNLSSPLTLFTIDVFTHSEKAVPYSISVEPIKDFVISDINSSYTTTTIKPPSPQVFYYKIPDNHDIVTVKVESVSEAVGCIYVSVQNNSCPFNDLFLHDEGRGIYQTMTKSAFLTIKAKWFEEREFLIVLAPANYSICHDPPYQSNNISSFLDDGQTVNIMIGETKPIKAHLTAIWFPVLISLAIIFISSLAVGCCCTTLCESGCIPIKCLRLGASNCYYCCPLYCKGASKCICCVLDSRRRTDTFEESSCNLCGPCVCVCFGRRNTSHEEEEDDGGDGRVCTSCASESEDEGESDEEATSERTPLRRSRGSSSLEGSGVELVNTDDQNNKNNQKRYIEYGWSTLTVGIFYALPAFQLIFFEQKLLDQSGNQDMCYYNFFCAHPAGPISAFNNVWSNICYVLLGLCFCFIVLYRHCRYKKMSKDPKLPKNYLETHGIPQYFGIYYALGIALILEGFMSSFYHICPSNANFQFDTAFMFITGGLLFIKMYQNRHPNVNANAFVAFFCFALIIFFTVVGIYNDRDHPFAVKLSFVLFIVVIILPFIVLSFYTIKTIFHLRKLKKMNKECTLCGVIKHHICKMYTFRHMIIIAVNIGVGIIIIVKYHKFGIATVVLIFIVMNFILYLVLYFLSKVMNREPLTLLALILPFLIGLSWIGAFMFYGNVTKWEKPPAESRELNKNCRLLHFYDNHDIWHMLSACGMFFAFLFVLVLDDGVANWKTKRLLKDKF